MEKEERDVLDEEALELISNCFRLFGLGLCERWNLFPGFMLMSKVLAACSILFCAATDTACMVISCSPISPCL